jgi:hypothetical protein
MRAAFFVLWSEFVLVHYYKILGFNSETAAFGAGRSNKIEQDINQVTVDSFCIC